MRLPLPLAELLTAGGSVFIKGKRWPLRITHGVLLHCEAETGLDMLNSFSIVQASSGTLLVLLSACLARAGATFTREEVGALITVRSLPIVRRELLKAWSGSMPEKGNDPAVGDREEKLTHLKAWAFARLELGLSDAEWLDTTPRQVQELSDVRLRKMQWWELLNGINTAASVNHSFCRPDKPQKAETYMIHPLEDGGKPKGLGQQIINQFMKLKGTKVVRQKGR